MAHAKPEHLKEFTPLIEEVRKCHLLKEKSFGCFYYKSKSVLHFHIKVERIFAHVYDGDDWQEVDLVSKLSATKQKILSKSILQMLPIKD